jgi:hypothetical protein
VSPVLLAAAALVAAGRAGAAQTPRRLPTWTAPVASLVVPGAGQLLLDQDRGIVYLAVEVFAVSGYLREQGLGRAESDRYRDLAFDVARAMFQPTVRDTVFEYFEQMARFAASGAFDLDPGPALVPETNTATYNGAVWLLARRTFWSDPNTPPPPDSPEYQRAVQFYVERAVGPGFRWSWHGASLERQAFVQAIRRADGAYRSAQSYVGLLLANHALSFVDAVVSVRLSELVGRTTRLWTVLTPHGARWTVVIPI